MKIVRKRVWGIRKTAKTKAMGLVWVR